MRPRLAGLGGQSGGGWGASGKVIVLGEILQRSNHVKVFAFPELKGNCSVGLVRAHTKPGSLYNTERKDLDKEDLPILALSIFRKH